MQESKLYSYKKGVGSSSTFSSIPHFLSCTLFLSSATSQTSLACATSSGRMLLRKLLAKNRACSKITVALTADATTRETRTHALSATCTQTRRFRHPRTPLISRLSQDRAEMQRGVCMHIPQTFHYRHVGEVKIEPIRREAHEQRIGDDG